MNAYKDLGSAMSDFSTREQVYLPRTCPYQPNGNKAIGGTLCGNWCPLFVVREATGEVVVTCAPERLAFLIR